MFVTYSQSFVLAKKIIQAKHWAEYAETNSEFSGFMRFGCLEDVPWTPHNGDQYLAWEYHWYYV